MPSIAPIGSIVRIQDVRLVVVGHKMARDGEKVGLCYVLVPYPLGFVNANSVTLTPVRKVDEVVACGFVTDAGEEYVGGLQSMVDATRGLDYDDYADAVLALHNYLKEDASNE